MNIGSRIWNYWNKLISLQKPKKDNNILCFIYNHNKNENSKLWLDRLTNAGFETYILDSGSDNPIEDERVLKFGNIYWGGMYDETINIVKRKKPKWVFHVDDDIKIDKENFIKLLKSINTVINDDRIGVYQPSTDKKSHNIWPNNHNKGTGKMRITPTVEEWMWLMRTEVLLSTEKFKLNWKKEMKYGWGVGLLFCLNSSDLGYLNVVDDSVLVVHPPVKAQYNGSTASSLMTNGLKKIGTNNIQLMNDCTKKMNINREKYNIQNNIIN